MVVAKLVESNATRIMVVGLIISFLLKIGIGFYLAESFFSRGNSYTPLNALAFNLLHHNEFSLVPGSPSVDYEPLYPLILAVGYGLVGKTWIGVTLIQACLHAATTWVLFLLTQRLAGRLAGTIAGLYHAFYPYLLFHSLSVVDTTLFVFLVVLFLSLVLKSIEQKSWSLYFFAGLTMGLCFLTRGSAIAFVPVPLIILAYCAFVGGVKVGLLRLSVVLLACLITVAPWTIRNYQLSGAPIISTHGAFGLWQGNNPQTYELLSNDVSLDEVYRKEPPEIYRTYSTKPRTPRKAVLVARTYQKEAFSFIADHPMEFTRLALLKFQKFWSWNMNPRMDNYAYSSHSLRQSVYFLSYFPLLLLFPVGTWTLLRFHFWPTFTLVGIVVTYTLAHMVVMGFTRARLPIDPILMILASTFIASLFARNASDSRETNK